MEVLVAMAMVLGMGALAGGLILYVSKQEQARKEGLEAKGWSYEKSRGGFKVEGVTDGVVWEYVLSRTGGDNKRSTAIWRTPAEPIEQIVLIGPSLPEALLSMGFSGMIVQFIAKRVLGEDGAADLARARELQVPEPLMGKASVIGTDSDVADAFLTTENVQALVDAQSRFDTVPAVLRWRDRLEVRPLAADVKTVESVSSTVELGVQLAKAAGYG